MKRIFAAALTIGLIAGCGEKIELGGKKGPKFRFAPIVRTDVVRTVEATGMVTPRNSPNGIPVGAQVNGKIIKMMVDYNSVVTNGQVVALIDPQVYEANYKSAVAQLHASEANVDVRLASLKSCEAELKLAEKTFVRKKALVEKNMAPVADFDSAEESLARAQAAIESARASLKSAKANVEQARAASDQAKANLEYCTIRSPVDGIVIDRKVEEGETVVSSMNAVPVVTIAEHLKTVWIDATVPEADVGNIRVGQEVSFTADAYRRRFSGKVKQIRRAATTTNNVVTFPVIIEAENPDEMLFPGMTATLSIETARSSNAIAVSSAVFRFRPKEEDLADIGSELPRGRRIWFVGNAGKLESVAVKTGVSDGSFTELVECDGLEGREAVVGYEVQRADKGGGEAKNPFMPQHKRPTAKGTAPEPKK